MQLSYISRLICVALCSAGLLQLLLESIAWAAAPFLLSRNAQTSARSAEKSLFLLGLFARLTPWLLVACVWVPAYVRGEDNFSKERVGYLCVAAAICVFGWSLFTWFRVLQAWISTQRYSAQCWHAGTSRNGLPVLIHPDERPLLATVGMFRSRIIVSQSLLASEGLSAAALDTAFLHESAHAWHRDNLKLVVLSLLPHVPFGTRKRPSLEQHWRLSAELAADEAGAGGERERSVLLAELLVMVARESRGRIPSGSFGLFSRAEDLRVRVDRLLQQSPASPCGSLQAQRAQALRTVCVAGLSMVLLASLCYLGREVGHRLAEVLLHIG